MADLIHFEHKGKEYFLNVEQLLFARVDRKKELVKLVFTIGDGKRHKEFDISGEDANNVIEQLDILY